MCVGGAAVQLHLALLDSRPSCLHLRQSKHTLFPPACRYDPASNRWLPGPSLQRKRFALGGASLGGALYAVGGYDGTHYLACAERLDPRTDRSVHAAPHCVFECAATLLLRGTELTYALHLLSLAVTCACDAAGGRCCRAAWAASAAGIRQRMSGCIFV